MNLHSFEKKKIVSEDDFNKKMLLDAKTLIEIIKRYCEENFKESNSRKEKMISFIKDFYVAHQSEPIENVDQLFLNENFEDSKLYKSKFHASYMQMKKLEKKSRVLFEENSNNSSKIRGLENRLSISVDALEYKIEGVKKVCLEELKLQGDKIEDTIKTRGKETDDKLSKHDIELDKLRLGIEEQQIKLKTHENSQVELRIELERKILKKMKSKLEKQKRRYDNQINLVKIEMKKTKRIF